MKEQKTERGTQTDRLYDIPFAATLQLSAKYKHCHEAQWFFFFLTPFSHIPHTPFAIRFFPFAAPFAFCFAVKQCDFQREILFNPFG